MEPQIESSKNPLLKVENLRIELTTRDGVAPVIDDLSFELGAGETISFVGESGCGKSMTALGIMGLLPDKIGRIASGNITFNGEDLTTASEKRLREIRGNEISMIFQEPMTSLNPVLTVGEQIAEVLRAHQGFGKKEAWDSSIELLDAVRIPNAKRRVSDYPFQMSGGQRQRVMIGSKLAAANLAAFCPRRFPRSLSSITRKSDADAPRGSLGFTSKAFSSCRQIEAMPGVVVATIVSPADMASARIVTPQSRS